MAEQLTLLVDLGSYDTIRQRKTRPSRHVAVNGKLVCGHKGLPKDGQWEQYPVSFKALIQVTECGVCKAYLRAKAVQAVIRRRQAG